MGWIRVLLWLGLWVVAPRSDAATLTASQAYEPCRGPGTVSSVDVVVAFLEESPWMVDSLPLGNLTPEKDPMRCRLAGAQHLGLLDPWTNTELSLKFISDVEQVLAPETVGLRGRARRFFQDVALQWPWWSPERRDKIYDPRLVKLEIHGPFMDAIHARTINRLWAARVFPVPCDIGLSEVEVARKWKLEAGSTWFQPFAVLASVSQLRQKLGHLRCLVEHERRLVERQFELLGIDPKTLGPIEGRRDD
jgi:hypothetical protein